MKFDKNISIFRNEDNFTKTFEISKLNASCLFFDTINFPIPKPEDRSTIKKSHLALFEYIMMASNAAKKFLEDVFNLFSKDENVPKENIKCNIYDTESHQVVDLYFYHLFESINQSIQDCKLENLNKTENVTENKVVFNFIDEQNSFIANNTINIENLNLKNLYLNTILPNGTEKVYFFENTDHQFEKLFLDYVEKIILVISKLEVDPNHSIKQKFDKTAQKTLKMLEFRILSNVYTEANLTDEVGINGIKNDDQESKTNEIEKAEDEAKKAISKYIFEVFDLPVDNEIIENTHKDKDKILKGERFKEVVKGKPKFNETKEQVLNSPFAYENISKVLNFKPSINNETSKLSTGKSFIVRDLNHLSTEENIFNEKNLLPLLFTICGCFLFILFLFGCITVLTSYLKKQFRARQEYDVIPLNDI